MTTRALRLIRPLAILALTTGLIGSGSDTAQGAVRAQGRFSQSHGVGYLRLAHLAPDTPAVDVYLYPFGRGSETVVLRDVGYGAFSAYQSVASGDYTLAMRPSGAAPTAAPLLSATVDVAAGHAYTVAGIGPKAGMRLRVIGDALQCPPGRAMVRVIQASVAQPQVTVAVGREFLAVAQAFDSVSPYRVVRPGTFTVLAAGTSEHAAARLTLAPGSIETLVVLDAPGHLAVSVLEDAAGSQTVPDGAAATGFGGTAPRPGGALFLWLALACTGLAVLTVGGVARFRQLRWARRAAAHVR
jgi:hypothetical protein